MRETFKSEKKVYNLNPKKIIDFINRLEYFLETERERRSYHGTRLRPTADLYIKNKNGCKHLDFIEYSKRKDFFGKSIDISTEEVLGKDGAILGGVDLGKITISKDGSELRLKINALNRIAINPAKIYYIAEEYSIK